MIDIRHRYERYNAVDEKGRVYIHIYIRGNSKLRALSDISWTPYKMHNFKGIKSQCYNACNTIQSDRIEFNSIEYDTVH